jgi:rhamnogalacturonyl hydrolase YesR
MKLQVPSLLCASLLLAAAASAQPPAAPATPPAQTPAATPAPYTPLAPGEANYQPTIPPWPGDLTVWPKGVSPQELGKHLADRFAATPLGRGIAYPDVCAWYGAFTFAELTHDDALRDQLIARFTPVLPGGPSDRLIPQRRHVDNSIFGVVPFEIAILTKNLPTYDPRYLQLGTMLADRQWEPFAADTPAAFPPDEIAAMEKQGLSGETRFWVDDMYMLTMLQLQAYRATGDRKYLDRDAHEMVAYLDKLQQPNGLFYHAPDVHYFWGRGDGWFAAGMAEMLRTLPADHPDRPRILAGYKLMMAALLKYQGADGMWRQLIDHPEAWPESSSSAMFSFALITGVKHGWLDAATYAPAARRGWIAVAGYVDQNYDVTQVCEGTNKFDSMQYYLDRKRQTGNLHGQAPVLWAASALLRDEK